MRGNPQRVTLAEVRELLLLACHETAAAPSDDDSEWNPDRSITPCDDCGRLDEAARCIGEGFCIKSADSDERPDLRTESTITHTVTGAILPSTQIRRSWIFHGRRQPQSHQDASEHKYSQQGDA